MKPVPADYPAYYGRYVSLVQQDDVMAGLRSVREEALALMRSIPARLEEHAYAEGKWTLKEVFLHCTDTERVFSYRALSYARGDRQRSLPFEENDYAANSQAATRSLSSIISEYEAVSTATLALFDSFSPGVLAIAGEGPSGSATVNSMGFMISGHMLHHLSVVKERYLK